jgi:murein DD-endopeptidase MepM/ murein hydrolase activator NlpD
MFAIAAACLITLPGPVTQPFAPEGQYAGHWGVDVAVDEGAIVESPLDGFVSFAGSVVGVRTVTVRQGAFRVSLSYLSAIDVVAGQAVRRGEPVGRAGAPHGTPGLHIGVRRGEVYIDPVDLSRCRSGGTIRLLPPMLGELVHKD